MEFGLFADPTKGLTFAYLLDTNNLYLKLPNAYRKSSRVSISNGIDVYSCFTSRYLQGLNMI